MSLWNAIKGSTISERIVEEKIYDLVLQEIESGERRGGLWLKAIENSGGDEKQVKLLYIKYRVQSVRDEMAISAELQRSGHSEDRKTEPDVLNAYDQEGHTPLMNAVLSANLQEVRSLLRRGAKTELKDKRFGTSTAEDMAILALRRASSESDRALLQELVDCLSGGST